MSHMRPTVSNRESHCLALARSVLGRLEQIKEHKQLPVPVETIASLCGYQVISLTTLPLELSGIVSLDKKLIGINSKHHPRRQRFSLAHELGHILLKHPPEARSSQEEIKRFNREADLFAAELLMPSDDLRAMATKECDLSFLRTRYDVSNEALRLKLVSLSLGPRLF
jgi:Zn-dependent peptidase ImmA (M78 family)